MICNSIRTMTYLASSPYTAAGNVVLTLLMLVGLCPSGSSSAASELYRTSTQGVRFMSGSAMLIYVEFGIQNNLVELVMYAKLRIS